MSSPVYRTRFVGRVADLAALDSADERGARLVTLHGPGGMGKTRLAVEHARRWRRRHRLPSVFCALAPARRVDEMCQVVSAAFGADLGYAASADAQVEQLGAWLAERGEGLVVLDNLEQLGDVAGPAIGHWVRSAPALRFVATSRIALGLAEEEVLPIGMLDRADASALLVARSPERAVDPSGDPGVLDRIVARLEGIPLAIELAAARLEVLSPHQLAARLDDRFAMLRDPMADDRQGSLWRTLEPSVEALDPVEREALGQLSVFAGPIASDAARAVVAIDADVDATLRSLARKSLLRDDGDGYAMLDTIRELARPRLTEPAPVEARHAAWFAARVEALGAGLHRSDGAACRAALSAARSDGVVAIERAIAAGAWAVAAQALAGLAPILNGSPLHAWFVARLDEVLGGSPEDHGWLRVRRAQADRFFLQVDDAERGYGEALAACAEPEPRAVTLVGLAEIAHQRKDPDAEAAWIAEALAVARDAGLTAVEAAAMRSRAFAALVQGDQAAGEAAAAEAIALARRGDDRYEEGYALCILAMLEAQVPRLDGAIDAARQAAVAFEAIGDQRMRSYALGIGADALLSADRRAEARAAFEEAIALRERFIEAGSAYMIRSYRTGLGLLDVVEGAFTRAIAEAGPAERAYRGIEEGTNAWYLGAARAVLAMARLGEGSCDEADAWAGQAAAAMGELRFPVARMYRDVMAFLPRLSAIRRALAVADRDGLRTAVERAVAARPDRDRDPPLAPILVRWVEAGLADAHADLAAWWLAADGTWFEPPHGGRVEVVHTRHHGLLAAVASMLRDEEQLLLHEDLVAAIWPGEQLVGDSGRARIYTLVSEVRKLGFAVLGSSWRGGYRVDGRSVRVVPERSPP